MNWLHGFVGLGRMAGPLVMTAVLTSDRPWQLVYGLVGGFVMALAMLFVLRRHLWRDRPGTPPAAGDGDGQMERVSIGAALRHPTVLIQVAVFFTYCGIETTLGQWGYSVLRERFDASQATAGVMVSLYWGALAVGRLGFGPFVERVVTVLGAALFLVPAYGVACAGVVVVGLGQATVFPTLITLTPRRLPAPLVTHAVGLSVGAAVVGGALFPTIAGLLESALGTAAIAAMVVALAVALLALNERLARAASRGS